MKEMVYLNIKLKIEEYRNLLRAMHNLCDQMPEIILNKYFNNEKYFYSLYFDMFNSIKGFCVLLGNGSLIPQACVVLRMALEQAATIRVLENHKDILSDYKDHQRYRFELFNMDKDYKEKKQLIKDHFKDKIGTHDNPYDYLEYGWFKSLDNNYCLDSLIKLSEIQKENIVLNNWKNVLNQWTHGTIKHTNVLHDENSSVLDSHAFIEIAAKLLDVIVCEFHNETKFNFKINGIDYRSNFIDAYKKI